MSLRGLVPFISFKVHVPWGRSLLYVSWDFREEERDGGGEVEEGEVEIQIVRLSEDYPYLLIVKRTLHFCTVLCSF